METVLDVVMVLTLGTAVLALVGVVGALLARRRRGTADAETGDDVFHVEQTAPMPPIDPSLIARRGQDPAFYSRAGAMRDAIQKAEEEGRMPIVRGRNG